jgi:hypothetical protein
MEVVDADRAMKGPAATKEPKVFGVYGKKGTGKDFVARVAEGVIRQRYMPCEVARFALADPIKDYCINALGIPRNLAYGTDEQKNTPTSYVWEKMPFKAKKSGPMTVRDVLQVVGTELGRDVWSRELWVEAMRARIARYAVDSEPRRAYVLVTDCRFPNEVEAVRRWGGRIWRIDGPQRIAGESKVDSHESERLDTSIPCDDVVDNRYGTTEDDLKAQVVAILEVLDKRER